MQPVYHDVAAGMREKPTKTLWWSKYYVQHSQLNTNNYLVIS